MVIKIGINTISVIDKGNAVWLDFPRKTLKQKIFEVNGLFRENHNK